MSLSGDVDALRKQYVKEDGQAPTVQGELVRAIEALHEDARGDAPWNESHDLLADFIGEILIGSGTLEQADEEEIRGDLAAIRTAERGSDRRPYDRLTARIVAWTQLHPEPVPHHPDPAIQR